MRLTVADIKAACDAAGVPYRLPTPGDEVVSGAYADGMQRMVWRLDSSLVRVTLDIHLVSED